MGELSQVPEVPDKAETECEPEYGKVRNKTESRGEPSKGDPLATHVS